MLFGTPTPMLIAKTHFQSLKWADQPDMTRPRWPSLSLWADYNVAVSVHICNGRLWAINKLFTRSAADYLFAAPKTRPPCCPCGSQPASHMARQGQPGPRVIIGQFHVRRATFGFLIKLGGGWHVWFQMIRCEGTLRSHALLTTPVASESGLRQSLHRLVRTGNVARM